MYFDYYFQEYISKLHCQQDLSKCVYKHKDKRIHLNHIRLTSQKKISKHVGIGWNFYFFSGRALFLWSDFSCHLLGWAEGTC